MSTAEAIAYLENYQKWRSVDDERTMDEARIKPRELTEAIDVVLTFAQKRLQAKPKDATKRTKPLA